MIHLTTSSRHTSRSAQTAPYVKLVLFDSTGKIPEEKQKTETVRRTLDPLYQAHVTFSKGFEDKILQVSVSDL